MAAHCEELGPAPTISVGELRVGRDVLDRNNPSILVDFAIRQLARLVVDESRKSTVVWITSINEDAIELRQVTSVTLVEVLVGSETITEPCFLLTQYFTRVIENGRSIRLDVLSRIQTFPGTRDGGVVDEKGRHALDPHRSPEQGAAMSTSVVIGHEGFGHDRAITREDKLLIGNSIVFDEGINSLLLNFNRLNNWTKLNKNISDKLYWCDNMVSDVVDQKSIELY